jgi:hypothetical protein
MTLTKATKYELIYKETLRKLSKICSDQIHNKQKPSARPTEIRRDSAATLKLITCFDARVEDFLRVGNQNPLPKAQEITLDEILRNLRY